MTVTQMRIAIGSVYSGEAWRTRVAKMSDGQITAIYLNLKKQGKV